METNEIIKIFLENKILLESRVIDTLKKHENKIPQIIEEIKKLELKQPLLTQQLLDDILEKEENIIVTKEIVKNESVTVSKFHERFLIRYNTIKQFIMEKPDFANVISIGKINVKMKKIPLVGLVKEVNRENKSLLLEDETSEIHVFGDEKTRDEFEEIVEDEVIGVVCVNKGNKFEIEDIVFPEIPLKRQTKRGCSDEKLVFVSGLNIKPDDLRRKIIEKLKTNKIKIVSLSPKIKSVNSNSIIEDRNVNFSKFSWILYKKKINILIFGASTLLKYKECWKDENPEKILLNLLKKRHLNPIFKKDEKNYDETDLILTEIPDIIVTDFFKTAGFQNYKGVVIISLSDFSETNLVFVVDLKTLETFKLDIT